VFAIWPHASLLLEPQALPQRGGGRGRGGLRRRGARGAVFGGRDIGADGEEEVVVEEEDGGDSEGGGGGARGGGGGGRGGWGGAVSLIGRCEIFEALACEIIEARAYKLQKKNYVIFRKTNILICLIYIYINMSNIYL
jgi:hypothetical protein